MKDKETIETGTGMARDRISDILRGLSMYLVVLGHIIPSKSALFFYINDLHMPMLFFLSGWWGFVSFEKNGSNVLVGKIHRLLLPYMSWSLVALVFNLAFQSLLGNGAQIGAMTAKILLGANSVWFFIVLYAAFGLMWLIQMAEKRGCHWAPPILFLMALLLPNELFMLSKLKVLFPMFYLGYTLRRVGFRFEMIAKGYFVRALSGGLFLVLPMLLYDQTNFVNYSYFEFSGRAALSALADYILYTALALCGVYFSISVLAPLLKKGRIGGMLASVGKYSMDIYGVHMFPVKLAAFITPEIFSGVSGSALVIQSVLAAGVTWLCWILAKYLLHRIKLYKAIFLGEGL